MKAQLNFSIDVECPRCNEDFDLTDSYLDDLGCVFTNRWEELIGFEVVCPHCAYEFAIDGLEY